MFRDYFNKTLFLSFSNKQIQTPQHRNGLTDLHRTRRGSFGICGEDTGRGSSRPSNAMPCLNYNLRRMQENCKMSYMFQQ